MTIRSLYFLSEIWRNVLKLRSTTNTQTNNAVFVWEVKAHSGWEIVEAGFCQQQLGFIVNESKDRYGGRADRSAKKTFCHGIVTARKSTSR